MFTNLQMIFANVVIPILLFGALVFFHELGHFTVAKLCGVFVERFAIGFGPALFRKRIGETEYAICAFPLGGYVKMRGEEPPQGDEKPNADPRSFAAQNVWKRIAIVIMGPTANFILPIVVFTALFIVGMPTPSTQVGSVFPGSPAESAGLIPGDRILEVEGQKVQAWNELNQVLQNRADRETEIVVLRNGEKITLAVKPRLQEDMNEFGESVQLGKIGVDIVSYQPVVGVSDPASPAYLAGVRTGDIVQSINGENIRYWWQLEEKLGQPGEKTISIQSKEKQKATVELKTKLDNASAAGLEKGELFISKVVENSIASQHGILPGDKLSVINGKKLNSWYEFRETIIKNRGEALDMEIIRDGKPVSVKITPEEVVQKNELTNERKKVRQLGVLSESVPYPIDFFEEKYSNPLVAFKRGFSETVLLTKQTFLGLWKLVSGKLSVNTLGGPISIFYMAGTSYESGGWISFFRLMALLSITLAALNILPIPVLDGGHLFFFFIEAIKGSPVHVRVQQMAMQVGFYLLMGLMVLVFYVDINRFFVDKIKALF